jgi:GT2 family glycosyltransferase
MKVYVHLLTWNGIRYLPNLFASLDAQTYKDFHLRIFDNGSQDGTYEYLREHRPLDLVGRNMRNQFFVGGHHAIMQSTMEHLDSDPKETIIILLNQDIILDPCCFEEMVRAMEDTRIAAIQPKLLRAFGEPTEDEEIGMVTQSDIIDSTGLIMHRDWRCYDRGEGVMDQKQYDSQTDIMGPSGTLPAYRLSAVLDVALAGGTLFDKDYLIYREDVDLALRLRRAGYVSRYVPTAIAHHYRGMYGGEHLSLWKRFLNRRRQRPFLAAVSLRNEIFTVIKHFSLVDFLYAFPGLQFYLGGRIVYGFFFESMTRMYLLKSLKHLPSLLDKKRQIRQKAVMPMRALKQYVSR